MQQHASKASSTLAQKLCQNSGTLRKQGGDPVKHTPTPSVLQTQGTQPLEAQLEGPNNALTSCYLSCFKPSRTFFIFIT